MAVEIVIACESWPPSAAIKGFKYCAALTKGWNITLIPESEAANHKHVNYERDIWQTQQARVASRKANPVTQKAGQ